MYAQSLCMDLMSFRFVEDVPPSSFPLKNRVATKNFFLKKGKNDREYGS